MLEGKVQIWLPDLKYAEQRLCQGLQYGGDIGRGAHQIDIVGTLGDQLMEYLPQPGNGDRFPSAAGRRLG